MTEEKKKRIRKPPSKLTLEDKKQQDLIKLVRLSEKLQKEKEQDGRI